MTRPDEAREADVEALAEILWTASQADESTISAIGAQRDRLGQQVFTSMTCAHDFTGGWCEVCWENMQRACEIFQRYGPDPSVWQRILATPDDTHDPATCPDGHEELDRGGWRR